MTLKNLFTFIAAVSLTLAAVHASADPGRGWGPGRGGGWGPGPGHGDGWGPGRGGGWGPRPPMPPPPPPAPPAPAPGYDRVSFPINVGYHFSNYATLDLAQFFNLYAYQGYRIERLDVVARSTYNASSLELMVNGYRTGQYVSFSPYMQTATFYPNNLVIGYNARNVALMVQGELDVDRIFITMVR